MRRFVCFLVLLLTCAVGKVAQADVYATSFDQPTDVDGWNTDRYEPSGFQAIGGQLRIHINGEEGRPGEYEGAFYNTQGRQRSVSAVPSWTVKACLDVTSDWFSGEQPMRTDVWARDNNPNENYAWYGIIGLTNASPTDPFNPDAVEVIPRFRVWDDDTPTGWVDLDYTSTHQFDTGQYCLSFDNEGRYYINDELVYDDYYTSDPGSNSLQTIFMQAYDYSSDPFGTRSNYSVYWDSLSVTPEPTTLTLFGLGAAALIRRRR